MKGLTGMFGGGLPTVARRLGQQTPADKAIPGDRPGQIALLRGNRHLRQISLEDLTDLMVEVTAFLIRGFPVVGARQKKIRHVEANHVEKALELIVALGRNRLTVILLPCGASAVTGILGESQEASTAS